MKSKLSKAFVMMMETCLSQPISIKTILLIILIATTLSLNLHAQFKKGDVELSFSGSVGLRDVNSNGGYQTEPDGWFYMLSISPGYYLLDGFSIEPELVLMNYSNGEGLFRSYVGNISYTYLLPDPRVAIYAKAGYGKANSVPSYGLGLRRVGNDLNVNVINMGIGGKYLLNRFVAFKAEFNYRRYSWQEIVYDYNWQEIGYNYYWINTPISSKLIDIQVLLGISILL